MPIIDGLWAILFMVLESGKKCTKIKLIQKFSPSVLPCWTVGWSHSQFFTNDIVLSEGCRDWVGNSWRFWGWILRRVEFGPGWERIYFIKHLFSSGEHVQVSPLKALLCRYIVIQDEHIKVRLVGCSPCYSLGFMLWVLECEWTPALGVGPITRSCCKRNHEESTKEYQGSFSKVCNDKGPLNLSCAESSMRDHHKSVATWWRGKKTWWNYLWWNWEVGCVCLFLVASCSAIKQASRVSS